MTQNLEKPPEEGSPRDRFRADARAEARWRRHEIAGRLSAIQNRVKDITKEAEQLLGLAVKLLTKEPKVFDAKVIPDPQDAIGLGRLTGPSSVVHGEILGELPPGKPKRKRGGKK